MNRVIKFRAWDTDKKVLVHETDLDILKNIFHIDFMDKEIGPPPIIYNIGRYNDNVLMQFTGLKDMNGKDIYEGDIISDPMGIGQIVFDSGSFCIKWNDNPNESILILESELLEIIGNLFETPELLKV